MSDLKKDEGKDLVWLLHHQNGDLAIPQPFERDIYLFDTYVAGTSHIAGMEELEPFLEIDEKLSFFREPDNEYDDKAIVIKTENGTKIGYIPKVDNIIFSRLMDAGKLLFGRITEKDKRGTWVRIMIRIYLHE
ncbi:MAG: HIRAN domain-containing protein [Tissierellia bacterium]|nr:HIRAN domain-containing protein [Tissierellia bacterium]